MEPNGNHSSSSVKSETDERSKRLAVALDCLYQLAIFYQTEVSSALLSMYAQFLVEVTSQQLREATYRCMQYWRPEKMRIPLPSELLNFLPEPEVDFLSWPEFQK
jgi:hypothetical protein